MSKYIAVIPRAARVMAALVEAVDYFGRCLRDSFAKQMEEKENDDNP